MHAADEAVLQAVAARDVRRAAALEPAGRVYGDYGGVIDDPTVDAVYIALTNDAHLPWTLSALAAGKHVLCEKPLCLDAAQVRTAFTAAETAGRLLVEASWWRWHPRTRRAEELVAGGEFGPVVEAEAVFCFPGVPAGNYRLDPAKGGGALLDIGCYAVSGLLWALGDLRVSTATVRLGETGVDLDARAVLRGAVGQGTVQVSMDAPEHQLLRLRGADGALSLPEKPFTPPRQPTSLLVERAAAERVETFPAVDAYRLMVESFGAQVAGRDALVVPAADSLRVASTLDAVRAAGTAAGS